MEAMLRDKTEEVRVLTERVNQLVCQALVDSDSIKALNKVNQELRQAIVEKDAIIHEQAIVIARLDTECSNLKEAIKTHPSRCTYRKILGKI
jgi:hypothetical protein